MYTMRLKSLEHPSARARMEDLKKELQSHAGKGVKVNTKMAGMIVGFIDQRLSRAGRIAFLRWAFDKKVDSSRDLIVTDLFALIEWASPRKIGDEWTYTDQFVTDLKLIASCLGFVAMKVTPCRMCKNGLVLRIQRDPRHPNTPTASTARASVTCQCCKGNYRNCDLCAKLGG